MKKIDALLFAESLILTCLNVKKDLKSNQHDYVDIFIAFKTKVSLETQFISQTFPEYTPHDEEFHLKRLFPLGEDILGTKLIESLNATELLSISLSIYGHDWGMAVSQAEKKAILNYCKGSKSDEFAFINLEKERFEKHLTNINEELTSVSDFAWQEYIRLTHAERSAARVKKYFENIDSGLGEAVSRICLGHWLDFKEIRNASNYPINYVIRGENINLRAITVYLRLIDLFDISNERTPYAIYKYTAPESMRSKLEWAKHKAVNSVATLDYQSGRIIQVDGQTSDYQVFAALEDLKNFCKEQLAGCNELLYEINNTKFDLNIFDLRWNIQPIGFDPISIKFQFDRKRMFEVLSDEIYKGDKYVFLRELLQNSIDAIKLRKEWVEKITGFNITSFGEIRIDVIDSSDDEITVRFSDDGIGMDQYIIEKYLSVAGKSYYRSEEFKKLGLEMDPISRFGVGILSCFMVADRIEILTARDITVKPDAKFYKIDVPSVDQQFRIEASERSDKKSGTTIITYLSKEKIKNRLDDNKTLEVSEYIKRVAGFVEYPIVISEHEKKTVIISPFEEISFFQNKYEGYEVFVIDKGLKFEEIFQPQSLKLAKETFDCKSFTLEGDLNLEHVVGSISFLLPKMEFLKIRETGRSWPTSEFNLISKEKRNQQKRLKIASSWRSFENNRAPKDYPYGDSSYSKDSYQVYLDGILVPMAEAPVELNEPSDQMIGTPYITNYFPEESFILPLVRANFSKSFFKSIDLARTELKNSNISWGKYIANALFRHLIEIYRADLTVTDLKLRSLNFAKLNFFYRLPLQCIIKEIGLDQCPVMMIGKGAKVKYSTWGKLRNQTVYLQPEHSYWFKQNILAEFEEKTAPVQSFLNEWLVEDFVVQEILYSELNNDFTSSYQPVNCSSFYKKYISHTHQFDSFRFISPPWLNGPPLIQQVWEPVSSTVLFEDNETWKTQAADIDNLNAKDLETFLYNLCSKLEDNYFDTFPRIGIFQDPFEDELSYGIKIMNFLNPFTKVLLRILSCIQIYDETKNSISIPWAQLIDKILELPFFKTNEYDYSALSLNEMNQTVQEINDIITKNNLILGYLPLSFISLESFVPGTVYQYEGEYDEFYQFFNNASYETYQPGDRYPLLL